MNKRTLYLTGGILAVTGISGCAGIWGNVKQWAEEQNVMQRDLNKIIQEAQEETAAKAAKKNPAAGDVAEAQRAEAQHDYAPVIRGKQVPKIPGKAEPAAQMPVSDPGAGSLEAVAADAPQQKSPGEDAAQARPGYQDGRIPITADVPGQVELQPAGPGPLDKGQGPGPKGYPLSGFYSGKVGFEYEIALPEKEGYRLVKKFSVLTEDTDRYIFDLYSGRSIDMRISMENTLDSGGNRLNSDVMLILEQGNIFKMTIDSRGGCKADDLLYEDEVDMLVEGLLDEYGSLRSNQGMLRHLHGYGRESIVPVLELVFE
ncbi:hypothetical protein GF351_02995 [Candidatus Woesearchaeota archaeon]|nr:hypothetical protein [Candidatus Woesearchaeota archaeon]